MEPELSFGSYITLREEPLGRMMFIGTGALSSVFVYTKMRSSPPVAVPPLFPEKTSATSSLLEPPRRFLLIRIAVASVIKSPAVSFRVRVTSPMSEVVPTPVPMTTDSMIRSLSSLFITYSMEPAAEKDMLPVLRLYPSPTSIEARLSGSVIVKQGQYT